MGEEEAFKFRPSSITFENSFTSLFTFLAIKGCLILALFLLQKPTLNGPELHTPLLVAEGILPPSSPLQGECFIFLLALDVGQAMQRLFGFLSNAINLWHLRIGWQVQGLGANVGQRTK